MVVIASQTWNSVASSSSPVCSGSSGFSAAAAAGVPVSPSGAVSRSAASPFAFSPPAGGAKLL